MFARGTEKIYIEYGDGLKKINMRNVLTPGRE